MDKDSTQEQSQQKGAPLQQGSESKPEESAQQDSKVQALRTASDASTEKKKQLTGGDKDESKEKPMQATRKRSVPDTTHDAGAAQQPSPYLTARDSTTLPAVTENLKQPKSKSVQSSDSAASQAIYPKSDGKAWAVLEPSAAAADSGASDVRHDQNAASGVTSTNSSVSAVPSQQSASSMQKDESDKSEGPPANVPCGQAESVSVDAGSLMDQFSSTAAQEGKLSDLSSVPSSVSPVDSSRKLSTNDVKGTSSATTDIQPISCDKSSGGDKNGIEETDKASDGLQPNQGSQVPQVTEPTGKVSDTGHVQPESSAAEQPSSVTTETSLANEPISSQDKPEKVPSATSKEGEQPGTTEIRPKSSIPAPPVYEEPSRRTSAKVDKEAVKAADEVKDEKLEATEKETAATDVVPASEPPESPGPVAAEEKIIPRQASLSGITDASVPDKISGESKLAVYIPQGVEEESIPRSMDIYSKLQDEMEKLLQDTAKPEPDTTSVPEQVSGAGNKSDADEGETADRTGEEAGTANIPDGREAVATVDGSTEKGSALQPEQEAPKESAMMVLNGHEAKLKEDESEKVYKEKTAPAGDESVKTEGEPPTTGPGASHPDKRMKDLESAKSEQGEEKDQNASYALEIEKDKGIDEDKLARSGDEKTGVGTAPPERGVPQEESPTAKGEEEVIADDGAVDSEAKRVKVASEDVQTDEEEHGIKKVVPVEHELGREETEQEKHAKDAEAKEIPAKEEIKSTKPEPPIQEMSKKEHLKDEDAAGADSKEPEENGGDVTMLAEAEKSSPSIKEPASAEEKEVSQGEDKKLDDVPSVTAENGAAPKEADAVSEEKPSLEVAQTKDAASEEHEGKVVREGNGKEEATDPKAGKGGTIDKAETELETKPGSEKGVGVKEDTVSDHRIESPHETPQDVSKAVSDTQKEAEAFTKETHDVSDERPTETNVENETAVAEGVAQKVNGEEVSKEERKEVCEEAELGKGGTENGEEPQETEPPAERGTEANEDEKSEKPAHEEVPEDTTEVQETVVASEAAAETAEEALDEAAAAPDEEQEMKDTEEDTAPPASEPEQAEAGEDVQKDTSAEESTSDVVLPADVPSGPPAEAAPSEVEAVSDVVSASTDAAEVSAEPLPPADGKKKSTPRSPSKRVSTKTPPKTLDKKDTLASQDADAKAPTSPKKPGTITDKGSSSPKKTAPSKNSVTSPSKTAAKTPGSEQKKLPPIKAPVGQAPRPHLKNVRSKIGSLDNIKHKPKGGEVKVQSQKLEWRAAPKVGSLDNASHKPGGGDKKILSQKLDFKAQPKVGSLDNVDHKPAGGQVKVGQPKVEMQKLEFKQKAAPKVGSLDNVKHKPGGGAVKIVSEKLDLKERASSKIGSLSTSDVSSNRGSETQSPIQATSPLPDGDAAAVAANGHEGDSDISPTKEEDASAVAPEISISPALAAPDAAEIAQC